MPKTFCEAASDAELDFVRDVNLLIDRAAFLSHEAEILDWQLREARRLFNIAEFDKLEEHLEEVDKYRGELCERWEHHWEEAKTSLLDLLEQARGLREEGPSAVLEESGQVLRKSYKKARRPQMRKKY